MNKSQKMYNNVGMANREKHLKQDQGTCVFLPRVLK